ncbi:hypothetical protein X975_25065, partial [Stegodyphus mimosarum]
MAVQSSKREIRPCGNVCRSTTELRLLLSVVLPDDQL